MSEHSSKRPDPAEVAAAILIQNLWRGKTYEAKNKYLTTEIRWEDANTHIQLQTNRADAQDGKNSPRERWKRAAFLAGRLQDSNNMLSEAGVHVEADKKMLETQHWLELIDGKHRYGSNLKYYHKQWQEEDTTENFFKWLDHGGGENLSLDECPRERLEKERIIFLSAEQRLNYLVKIDEAGRLLWARNNQPIDTTAGHWKDAGEGRGIVPQNLPIKDDQASFTRSRSSSYQENAATHYTGQTKGRYRWTRYLRQHYTPHGVVNRLLRKTVKRNTWIYVSDKNFNIFIGIKETGSFQHSSFTSGGLVTSAGLISVKKGIIYTLSPLSGHYRTSINHFHKFIEVLTDLGVDMHKVRISKAEAALWGIEHIKKWKKKQGKLVATGKEKIKTAEKSVVAIVSGKDEASNWKKDILEGRH